MTDPDLEELLKVEIKLAKTPTKFNYMMIRKILIRKSNSLKSKLESELEKAKEDRQYIKILEEGMDNFRATKEKLSKLKSTIEDNLLNVQNKLKQNPNNLTYSTLEIILKAILDTGDSTS